MTSKPAWYGALVVAAIGGATIGHVLSLNAQPVSEGGGATGPILYSGPAAYVYWRDHQDRPEGYTMAESGLPGASSDVKVAAAATVYQDWVAVQRSKTQPPRFIPRERLLVLQFDK